MDTFNKLMDMLTEYGVDRPRDVTKAVRMTIATVARTSTFVVTKPEALNELTEASARLLRFVPFLRLSFQSLLGVNLLRLGIRNITDSSVIAMNLLFDVWHKEHRFDEPPCFKVFIESYGPTGEVNRVLVFAVDTYLAVRTLMPEMLLSVKSGGGSPAGTREGLFKLFRWSPDALYWYRALDDNECDACGADCEDRYEYDNTQVRSTQWLFDHEGNEIEMLPEPWMVEMGLMKGPK